MLAHSCAGDIIVCSLKNGSDDQINLILYIYQKVKSSYGPHLRICFTDILNDFKRISQSDFRTNLSSSS